MQRFLLATVLAISLAGFAKGQGTAASEVGTTKKVETEIFKLEDEQNTALVKGDTRVLDRIYADDITWTNANGEISTKAEVLAAIRSGKRKFISITHDDVRLRIYGNTVVLNVRSTSTEQSNGETYNYPRRFTNVYVKQDGQWRIVVHHVTPIAKQ
jgi:uncharacterized protein (TIGR02246 family)